LKLLFDHNVDRRFRRHVPGHEIKTTREMRWELLSNGKLLRAAADAGFGAFVSIDKKLQFEQNLDRLPIAVIVLDSFSNALPALIPFAPFLQDLLKESLLNVFHLISPDGRITRIGTPPAPSP